MKGLRHEQIQNLIFIGAVMVVAAAALVYLFLHDGKPPGTEAETPQPTAVSTPAPEKDYTRFEAAPTSVLMMQLENDARICLEEQAENEYLLSLLDETEQKPVPLSITSSNGRVTSCTWVFARPVRFSGKPKNDIEARVKESYDAALSALRAQVEPMLVPVIEAADLNGVLLPSMVGLWCEGALKTLDEGDSFRSSYKGCIFTAYASREDGADTLVCALLMN